MRKPGIAVHPSFVRRILTLAAGLVLLTTAMAVAAQTDRVNVNTSGGQANAGAVFSSISGDGTKVVFTSRATDLVKPATVPTRHIFLRDFKTGKTILVSRASDHKNRKGKVVLGKAAADGFSFSPMISANGKFVVFASDASNLVKNDENGSTDVFRRSLTADVNKTILISRKSDKSGESGAPAVGGPSTQPVVSANGKVIAFVSQATNLFGGDKNGKPDVYVRNLETGKTTALSVREGQTLNGISGGADVGNGNAGGIAISGNGKVVAYGSTARLHAADTDDKVDVYDQVVDGGYPNPISSHLDEPCEGGCSSFNPSLNHDGSVLAFWSDSSATQGDTNNKGDIIVLRAGNFFRVNLSSDEEQDIGGALSTLGQSLSNDGNRIVFATFGALVDGDDPCTGEQVYMRDLGAGTTTRISVGHNADCANGFSNYPAISANGEWVTFTSIGSNVVSGDTNSDTDVFRRGEIPASEPDGPPEG